jgi:DNA-binding CsgD family transcriptional regulator
MLESRDSFAPERVSAIMATIGKRRGKTDAALANLGMLCGSGLSARQVVRTLPNILRQILPLDAVGLFWSSRDGDMTDCWIERPDLMSSEVLHSCELYRQENPVGWPSFTENVMMGPVTGVLLDYHTAAFHASEFYLKSYAKIGIRTVLDAVVHDGVVPHGCYLMMRQEDSGPFADSDIDHARKIAALTLPAFTSGDTTPESTRTFVGGIAIVDADFHITFRNTEAHQTLWMLARGGNANMIDHLDDDFDTLLRRFCAGGVARCRKEGAWTESIANEWGEFILRYGSTSNPNQTVVSFDQNLPFACHIAQRLTTFTLSARQVVVCWLLLWGYQRKEISWRLGVSIDTVGEHIDSIFSKLGVSSGAELIRLFSQ